MGTCKLISGDVTAEINAAAGGRISAFRVGNFDLVGRCGPAPFEWGCFVMAPYAGRVRGGKLLWEGRHHSLPINQPPHALHGVTLDRPWEIAGVTSHGITLTCEFDERWPWPGHVEHHIEVRPDGLDARITVYAHQGEMPAWCGWHPWFARTLSKGLPVRIDLVAGGMLQRDESGIATREVVPIPLQPWDDCFVDVDWPIRLTWPGALSLDVTADTRHAVVFTGRPSFVCVEPQTAPPDAVALDDFSVVTPENPLTATMSWTITRP